MIYGHDFSLTAQPPYLYRYIYNIYNLTTGPKTPPLYHLPLALPPSSRIRIISSYSHHAYLLLLLITRIPLFSSLLGGRLTRRFISFYH